MPSTRRDFLKQLGAGAAGLASTCAGGDILREAHANTKVRDADTRNLILLGWDGAGLNNVGPMLKAGKLPQLRRFMKSRNGQMVPLQLIGRTCTVPSWSEVFTGLTYDQTGITGNNFHDLEANLVMGREPIPYDPKFNEARRVWDQPAVWYSPIPYEHSITRPIRKLGHAVGFFVSKRYLADIQGQPFQEIAGHTEKFRCSDPVQDLTVPLSKASIDDAYLEKLTRGALRFMSDHKKYFIFLHLDPDVYGHKFGEASKRYHLEFQRCDGVLGQIMDAVSPAETKIIVMADHGFDPGTLGHHNAPDAWMATDLPVDPVFVRRKGQKTFGTMRDVAHTILDHYGIPLGSMPLQMRGVSMLL